MIQKHKIFLITFWGFLTFFALVDLKNYLNNGASFVVSEDIFDKLKSYLEFPGMVAGFLVVMIVYQNIHNYDFYVLEAVSITTSSMLYGWIMSLVLRIKWNR